ncbi:hypothetical protein AB0J52_28685, partial [Spirillospora sp. NPDC049652]
TPPGAGPASPSPNAQVPPSQTPPGQNPPGPGPGPGSGDEGGGGADQPVRRTGSVVMVAGSSHDIDLDSQASGWTGGGSDLELRSHDGRLVGVNPAAVANLPAGSSGSWHQCATQRAYAEDARLQVGALVCVITTERRYALLRVTSVHRADGQADRVGLAVKVWDPRNAS